jgi:hypothetical protein
MKVSHVEGIANHNGLESCGGVRKDDGKALTEECTGRVLSREMHALPRKRQALRDADAVGVGGRQYQVHRQRKVHPDPARSQTPCMCRSSLCGNREILRLSAVERTADRIEKSRDVRR